MGMGVREFPVAKILRRLPAGRAGDGLVDPISVQASLDRDRTRPPRLGSLRVVAFYSGLDVLARCRHGAGETYCLPARGASRSNLVNIAHAGSGSPPTGQ